MLGSNQRPIDYESTALTTELTAPSHVSMSVYEPIAARSTVAGYGSATRRWYDGGMELYTRRGDDGTTQLFGGQRVNKDDLRVETNGCVDELNSSIGLARCACAHEQLTAILRDVQDRLFELGTDLATPEGQSTAMPRIGGPHVETAEDQIDAVCQPLPELENFVLPGGSDLAARLHLARSVCRRAERLAVKLARQETINTHALIYLNRLSDLLFAMARRANQLEQIDDVPWTGRT